MGRLKKGSAALHKIENTLLKHPFFIAYGGSDLAMYSEVAARKVYDVQPPLDQYIYGRPIIDIGANIGAASAYFASRYPDSMILAVEPHPRNIRLLRKNASRYGKQIQIIEAALGLDDIPIPLANPDVANEGRHASYVFSADIKTDRREAITAKSITPRNLLVNLKDQKIGLIKIDIEGAEREIFASKLIDPLLKAANIFMIETHDRYFDGCTNTVKTAAARCGFIQFKERGNEHFFVNRSAA